MKIRLGSSVVALSALLLAAGCSSGGSPSGAGSVGTSPPATMDYTPPACEREAGKVEATRTSGSDVDWDLTSFDGTKIRMHWMPALGEPAGEESPTLLMGPGWSLSGSVDTEGGPNVAEKVFGGLGVHRLRQEGYNVLTWDPRGFGKSGGEAEVDSPEFEGRDVQAMIDWVSTQPGVLLDSAGDPRMGMLGGSYGGGIQFVTAAEDCRVDAIVPAIAWHSLGTSLYKADTVKAGWAGVLISVAPGAHLDPHIMRANEQAKSTGVLQAEERDWFLARGPGDLVKKVRVPTRIVQGTADTLFTLDEGVTNYRILREAGVPVSMVWYCGGHGPCLVDAGDPDFVSQATLSWLARWVKRDATAKTGSAVNIIDQDGHRYELPDYPVAQGTPLTAAGSGELELVAEGGAGPIDPKAGGTDLFASIAGGIIPAPATNAVTVSIPAPESPVLVVGAPELTLTYRGTVAAGERPTRLFAQLVDETTGLTVGNQITPIQVTLDGEEHDVTVPLEVVAFAARPDSKLSLQVVATTVAYAQPRLGGKVTLAKVTVELPVAKGVVPPEQP